MIGQHISHEVLRALGSVEQWSKQCHAASLRIVQECDIGMTMRVARGFCKGIIGQHTWVVIGEDCYDPAAFIIDATWWSYTNSPPYVLTGRMGELETYLPHGSGIIWMVGKPPEPVGDVIELEADLSTEAREFLSLIGYGLDMTGWRVLANLPVGGWPSKEILTAMWRDDRLRACCPIDVIGMVTDLNPSGLYLKEKVSA